MAHDPKRPGLRERVRMRKRGIDPDRPKGGTPTQRRLKTWGLILQMICVFGLLGYIVYYVQGTRVELRPDILIILSAIFVVGRVMTFLGSGKSLKL